MHTGKHLLLQPRRQIRADAATDPAHKNIVNMTQDAGQLTQRQCNHNDRVGSQHPESTRGHMCWLVSQPPQAVPETCLQDMIISAPALPAPLAVVVVQPSAQSPGSSMDSPPFLQRYAAFISPYHLHLPSHM